MSRNSLSLLNTLHAGMFSLLASLGATSSWAADPSQGIWECRSGGSGGWDCSWSGPGQPPQPTEHIDNRKPEAERSSANTPAEGEGTGAAKAEARTAPPSERVESGASAEKGPAITPIDEPNSPAPEKIGSGSTGTQQQRPSEAPTQAEASATPEETGKAEAPQEKRPSRIGRFKNWLGFGGEKKAEPENSGKPADPAAEPIATQIEARPEPAQPQPAAKEIAPDIGVMDDPPKGAEQPAPAPVAAATEEKAGEKKSILGRMGGWLGLGGKKAPEPAPEKTEQTGEPGKVMSDIGIKADNKR